MFAIAKINSSSLDPKMLVVNYPNKWDEIVIKNPELTSAEMLKHGALFENVDNMAILIPTQNIVNLVTNNP